MVRLVTLATCTLNQWSLDFTGNLSRIRQSILDAKAKGAKLRIGPELEICGYGCQDHFYESDTYTHSLQSLADLLTDPELYDIVIDVGLPIQFRNVNYNCRVIFLNGKILLIRPKLWLANHGNYREMRWFSPWQRPNLTLEYILPKVLQKVNGQRSCQFGDGVLDLDGTVVGVEMCEELFTPNSPHIHMGLDGVEIFTNGSGSHHELRKLHLRIDAISEAMTKSGGVYMYANQQGCDGDRMYYDGSALIAINGKIVAQSSQFSLHDVEVIVATVDLDQVTRHRSTFVSRSLQATRTLTYPRITSPFDLESGTKATPLTKIRYHLPAEEISLGPACWLWDYLRRSNMSGYFLPLSGGLDSASTATIVASMCQMVVKECADGNKSVIRDVQRIVGIEDYLPSDSKDLANLIFHTAYIGTENSGTQTRQRAAALAKEIGCYHLDFDMDNIIKAILVLFTTVTNQTPKYSLHGGTPAENLALQNIQARMRMVLSYLFAQLLPWCRGKKFGSLLVLGSSNVDESLRGYFTKYDCSSADLNPIGALSKYDLRLFLEYSHTALNLQTLPSFLAAAPSAELIPLLKDKDSGSDDQVTGEQLDEVEMGLTYDELSQFGKLRQLRRLGPYSMYQTLITTWDHLEPKQVAEKVKRFYYYYAINRHKMTTLTPSYHAEAYSPDDHRYDLRPFLYPAKFEKQFSLIDAHVASLSD